MTCPVCGHSPSRLPLWVAIQGVVILFLSAALCVLGYELDRLRDRVDRIPIVQHSVLNISGMYPHIKVYPEGWDVAEPERMLVEPVKPNGKKK